MKIMMFFGRLFKVTSLLQRDCSCEFRSASKPLDYPDARGDCSARHNSAHRAINSVSRGVAATAAAPA